MDTVGLRHPQFSEDLTWLPTWVHQHHTGASVEHATEPHMSSAQDLKDMSLPQGNVNKEKDIGILLKEEANRCHLFLSGEDSSPISTASLSGAALYLSLRLSETGNSQYSQDPTYLSQALCDSGKALSVQPLESSPAYEQKTSRPKTYFTSCKINSSPLISITGSMKTVGPQCLNKNRCGRSYEEISGFSILKVTDVNSAVDLLVAASEALAIHNLTKGKSASEGWPTASILEAALRVKQARLEGLAATLACETNEIDEIDSLSDLDDFIMADALEDVGLCFGHIDDIHICGSDTSHFKDTPVSEKNDGCDNDSKYIEHMARPIELLDDQAFGWKVSDVASPNDPISHQPINIITDVAKLTETSVKLKKDMTKSIFRPFIGETSLLSESADFAPDENSFVQCGSKNDNSSPLSVPYEGLCEKTKVWNLNSLLAARSNLSSVDPLCSVVPCSISLENAGSPPSQNQCDREVNAEMYFCPTSEFVSERVVCRDNKDNHDNIDMGSQFVERTLYESNYHEPAEVDIELHATPSTRHSPPVNLDQSICRCAQSSMCCIHTSSGERILEETLAQKTMTIHNQSENLPKNESCFNNSQDVHISATKRVHFSDIEVEPLNNNPSKRHSSHQSGLSVRASKSLKHCDKRLENRNCKTSNCLMNCRNDQKRLIFQDIEFLLTGFSNEKQKEIEGLVRKYGGIVLLDIPSPSISRAKKSSTSCSQQLPVVLSSKKLKTTKFLYGCAVNALILKVKWLTDSIAASKVKPPDKYMVLPNQAGNECSRSGKLACLNNSKYIFDGVGIMLHGKHGFCAKLAMISKHGCAQVFKTLQSLVQRLDTGKVSIGAIVAEDESRVSRHLRQCAFERKIPIVSAIWIVKSLHFGKLIPVTVEKHVPLPMTRIPKFPISLDWSQEI